MYAVRGVAFLILLVSLHDSSEAFYACRWSRSNKYCLAFLSKDAVAISFNVAHNQTAFEWPDDELDELLRKYGVRYDNIKEVDFRENCNWAFNWAFEEARQAVRLTVLRFSRKCVEWAKRAGYCIDAPKPWRSDTVVLNAEFCDEIRISSASVESNSVGSGTPQLEASSMNTIKLLNASLQRALSLHDSAERERLTAIGQVEALDSELELCRAAYNSTTELYHRRSRQLRRCRSTSSSSPPEHRVVLVKQLLATFTDRLLKILEGLD